MGSCSYIGRIHIKESTLVLVTLITSPRPFHHPHKWHHFYFVPNISHIGLDNLFEARSKYLPLLHPLLSCSLHAHTPSVPEAKTYFSAWSVYADLCLGKLEGRKDNSLNLEIKGNGMLERVVYLCGM